jgi:hypothetical protein
MMTIIVMDKCTIFIFITVTVTQRAILDRVGRGGRCASALLGDEPACRAALAHYLARLAAKHPPHSVSDPQHSLRPWLGTIWLSEESSVASCPLF